MIECYIGIGGNQEKTLPAIKEAVAAFQKHPGTLELKLSRLYRTSPVSHISQPDYLNAVCRLTTRNSLEEMGLFLSNLEIKLGREPEILKYAPRLIDLDLLFYGNSVEIAGKWIVPHPKWHERKFVLAPLSDVTEVVPVGEGLCIREILKRFTNPHQEKVEVLHEKLLLHA